MNFKKICFCILVYILILFCVIGCAEGETVLESEEKTEKMEELSGENDAEMGSEEINIEADSDMATEEMIKIGDVMVFGAYEQDDNADNGQEPIEWIVLDREDDMLFLISRYAIENQPYHNKDEEVTWENCSLRFWLNDYFYYTAFSEQEREQIVTVTNYNHNASILDGEEKLEYFEYQGVGGNNTEDKVFILSGEEVKEYFNTGYGPGWYQQSDELCVKPTEYAIGKGVYVANEENNAEKYVGYCSWWIRTPGYLQDEALFVCLNGALYSSDVETLIAIRPAICIEWKDNQVSQETSEDIKQDINVSEIDETLTFSYIDECVALSDETEIEAYEWMQYDNEKVLRVKVQYKEFQENAYRHKEDYFIFIDENNTVMRVVFVNYEDKGIHRRYSEGTSCEGNHLLGEGCSFDAHFEDVTFDGHKDLLIWVGNSRHAYYYCAYVYDDEEFYYEKSFEHIPSYKIDYEAQVIRASDTDGLESVYEGAYAYINEEFVEIEGGWSEIN